jgi:uncharacterized membrane protein YcaP (DUF421 family)
MENILRAVAIYFFVLLVLRLGGKRSLQAITTFDFVLLLIIGETTQQALVGRDYSITNACIVLASLVLIDIAMSELKRLWPRMDRIVEGLPLVVLENGRPLRERMDKVRIDESDILAAARELQGLERMEQIKYAILERSGGISIIPVSRS